MINRRIALLSGLSIAGLWSMTGVAAAQMTAQDQTDIARVEAYLNSIHSLKARFVQAASDGSSASGIVLLQRPGKMRFQYDPPTPFLLVANYGSLMFYDSQLNQTSHIPLSRTPLSILLADHVTLSGAVLVTNITRYPGQLQLSMVREASPGEGTLTLIFADKPLALRQWIVRDAQGKETRVAFTNMDLGASIDSRAFEHQDVPASGGGGGSGG